MEFNPLSDDYFNGAWGTYRWLRDEAPIYRSEHHNFWALSRYDDVLWAFRDWATFISSEGMILDHLNTPGFHGPDMLPGFVGVYDPPDHTHLRRLANSAFTPKAVGALEQTVRSAVRKNLDALRGREEFDFIEDFAKRFPAEVLYDLMGIPEQDRARARQLTADFLYVGDGDESLFSERRVNGMVGLVQYLMGLSEEKRRNPTDDIMTRMMQGKLTDEDGSERQITDYELANYLLQLLSAGVDTTTKLIGNGFVAFSRNPGQWQKILDDPSKIPAAIEEIGRYEPSVHYLGRKSTKVLDLHGVTVPAKSNFLLLIGSANRDERVYEDPDRFDIDRLMPKQPITYGAGPHLCIGAHLARLEAQAAFEAIREHWSTFSIAEERMVRDRELHVFGWTTVPTTVSWRTTALSGAR